MECPLTYTDHLTARSVMRRPSLLWSQLSTDGSKSPSSIPSATPSPNFRGSSYFTSKRTKRANKTSEESPMYSSPLSAFWKQYSSDVEVTPKGSVSEDTPESTEEAKSPRQNVQDWNTTRLFDPRPGDSINDTPMQGIPNSNSDWNVTRSYDARPTSPQHSIDPPRPARKGYEWVWFPAGYWAERQLPANLLSPNSEGTRNDKYNYFSKFPERESNESVESTSPRGSPRGSRRFWGSFSSKVAKQYTGQSSKGGSKPCSAISTSRSERFLNTLHSISPTYPRYLSPAGELEGLYGKTKRNLTSKRQLGVPFSRNKKPKIETPSVASSRVASSTARVLEGAISYFDIHQAKNSGDPSTVTPESSIASSGSKRQWRKFGTAPWHRRKSDNTISASSSVCDLLIGRTPIGTPKSESRYVSSIGKSHVKVEISDPDGPNFLPSEAQRVDTPLWSPKRDPRRSFLSNMFPFESEKRVSEKQGLGKTTPQRDATHATHTTRSALRKMLTPTMLDRTSRHGSSDSENDTGRKSTTAKPFSSQNMSKANLFVLNVPDHLPNSPLCPANPMHTSKGQGICPMHGRKKDQSHSPSISRSPTPDIEIIVTSD
ncbi:accessory factor associated with RNA polymerase II [Ciborinia camelliae]|nr:accessory factor associated with RNA polymerase II [Ciborinia camelliae]